MRKDEYLQHILESRDMFTPHINENLNKNRSEWKSLSENVMTKPVSEGRRGKINQKDYKFYVVNPKTMKIHGGYEYREDAKDLADEHAEMGHKMKVLTKRALVSKGSDPDNNDSWGKDSDLNEAKDFVKREYMDYVASPETVTAVYNLQKAYKSKAGNNWKSDQGEPALDFIVKKLKKGGIDVKSVIGSDPMTSGRVFLVLDKLADSPKMNKLLDSITRDLSKGSMSEAYILNVRGEYQGTAGREKDLADLIDTHTGYGKAKSKRIASKAVIDDGYEDKEIEIYME
jgi:hypothetical protein